MTGEEPRKKISDNPSTNEMKALLPAMQALGKFAGLLGRLGIKSDQMKAFKTQVEDIAKQAEIIDLPDRFNDAFGKRGWIAVGGAMSVDVMKAALALELDGKPDEADRVLVDWFTKENIELFAILRARRFHQAQLRDDQLKEALQLYLEERYMAAVPLILIACDGFASDVAPVSPFEKDADLSCFDSITGHSTALPALIKLLTTGVRKSRDDEISLPLRHGILHGRSLGYASKEVCAKSWLLMMALVDWALDKASEDERRREHELRQQTDLSDTLQKLKKTQEDKRALDAFQPHEVSWATVEHFAPDGPEQALLDFLEGWQAKNYGKMGTVVVNMTNKSASKMAGDLRAAAEYVELLSYDIKTIRYSTVAACDVRISVRAKTLKKEVNGELDFRLLRFTREGKVAMPSDEDARWVVQQNCIYNVMNEKFTIDPAG